MSSEAYFMNVNKKLIAIALVLVIAVAVILPSCKSNKSVGDEVVVVTDRNGVPITDKNGEAITVVLETEIVEVTNANGEKVLDENGEPKTSIIYHSKDVEVPVIGSDGKPVTDAKGNIMTTMITVPPKTQEVVTAVEVTDPNGNPVVDESGSALTYTLVYTTSTADPGSNSSNWGTTYGGTQNDSFKAMAATPDGGCVSLFQSNSKDGTVSGLVSDSTSVPFIVIIKYDQEGRLKWQKVLSGNGALQLNAADVDADGNIYIAGFTKATDMGFSNYGDYDAVLCKLNSSGDIRWVKNFGGSSTDGFYGVSVCPDGVVAAGLCASGDGNAASLGLGSGRSAAVIVKFDTEGNVKFAKGVGSAGDTFNSVDADSVGNIYAVGNFSPQSAAIKSYGRSDGVAVMFDANGNQKWLKQYGGSQIDNFNSVVATNDGCVIVGRSRSADFSLEKLGNQGDYDAIIVKYGQNGNIIFENTFRGPGAENFNAVTLAANGTIVIAGQSASGTRDLKTVGNKGGSDAIIVTYGATGNVSSVQGYGGGRDDAFTGICVLKNGEYVACGSTLSVDGDLVGARAPSDGTHTVGMIAKFK